MSSISDSHQLGKKGGDMETFDVEELEESVKKNSNCTL